MLVLKHSTCSPFQLSAHEGLKGTGPDDKKCQTLEMKVKPKESREQDEGKVKTRKEDKVKIGCQQQLADSALPLLLLLARDCARKFSKGNVKPKETRKLEKGNVKPNETREQDEGEFGQQQQLADGALPLLLARASTRKLKKGNMNSKETRKLKKGNMKPRENRIKDKIKISEQQQLADSAPPLLLDRDSTRERDEQGAGGTANLKLLLVACTVARICQNVDSFLKPPQNMDSFFRPPQNVDSFLRPPQSVDSLLRLPWAHPWTPSSGSPWAHMWTPSLGPPPSL